MNDPAGAPQDAAQGSQAPSGDSAPDRAVDSDKPEAPKKRISKGVFVLIAIALVLVALLGFLFWLHERQFESTDDAFVDAHIVRLAPQIAGRITRVLVNDNQPVQPGQLLIEIDSADTATRVAKAQADKAQAQAVVDNAQVQIGISLANFRQAQADVAAASAQADLAARDLARYLSLQRIDPKAVARQQLDQALQTARQTAAQRDSAVQAASARAEQVAASRTQVASGKAQVRSAQAELNQAGLNYGYSRIYAPIAGHIAQDSVAVGNYVQPGTQVLAIVPLEIWITANFKETQLARMRVGQRVSVRVDACPQDKFAAHVDSVQRGAGQAFNILPAENATGNYVKVVQRVPVKIVLDNPPADCVLGPGMSVEPTVTVR